jgi:hypothetical protein
VEKVNTNAGSNQKRNSPKIFNYWVKKYKFALERLRWDGLSRMPLEARR